MVKNLFKYEIKAYLRKLLPFFVIVCCIGLLNRCIQFFETNSATYSIVFYSSLVCLFIGILVCLIMTVVMVITRFYRNMYSLEGYLTFTLPVSTNQHIWVKVLTAMLFTVIGLVVCCIAGAFAMAGDVFAEVWKAFWYLVRLFFDNLPGDGVIFVIEAVILCLLILAERYLFIYSCISVGQLAKKNRILAAVGIYFGWYFVRQIIGTLLIIWFNVFSQTKAWETILAFIDKYPIKTVHIILPVLIVIVLICIAVCWLLNRWIMNRRLNLE